MAEGIVMKNLNLWKEESILEITKDEMEAKLYLSPSAEALDLHTQDIVDFLVSRQIKVGIKQDAIAFMLHSCKYNTPILVAAGIPPKHSKDGSYEFRFEMNKDRKPRILEDGSVDYSQFEALALVKKDDLLAVYHHAERAENGINIKGAVLVGKQGKDLQPLKGKGYYTTEDKTCYYSNLDGRVEYQDGYMTVSDVLEIDGNVDNITGNIVFTGDVKIKGDVVPKMQIKAGGYITVDGHVEAAHLIAGKGLILKNGMQGSGKGIIESRGEVSGKFFESTVIRATGPVKANVILNCDVQTDDEVIISGKRGAIVGGKTWAARQITAFSIGNSAEARTEVAAGVDRKMLLDLKDVEKSMRDVKEEICLVNKKIETLERAVKNGTKDMRITPLKMTLLRSKILMNTRLTTMEARYRRLVSVVGRSADAKIVIQKELFPGVLAKINNSILEITEAPVCDVTLREKEKEVAVVANE